MVPVVTLAWILLLVGVGWLLVSADGLVTAPAHANWGAGIDRARLEPPSAVRFAYTSPIACGRIRFHYEFKDHGGGVVLEGQGRGTFAAAAAAPILVEDSIDGSLPLSATWFRASATCEDAPRRQA